MKHSRDGVTTTEKVVTISEILQDKILKNGIKLKDACAMVQKATGVSHSASYSWFNGSARPMRKYLHAIASVMRIHESRLRKAWYATAVARTSRQLEGVVEPKPPVKATPKKTLSKKPKSIKDSTIKPSIEDLEVSISLIKNGNADNVMAIVKLLKELI